MCKTIPMWQLKKEGIRTCKMKLLISRLFVFLELQLIVSSISLESKDWFKAMDLDLVNFSTHKTIKLVSDRKMAIVELSGIHPPELLLTVLVFWMPLVLVKEKAHRQSCKRDFRKWKGCQLLSLQKTCGLSRHYF